jgi:hypothetical protein
MGSPETELSTEPCTNDLTITERAALVTWHLAHGEGMTTTNAAEMAELTYDGAYKLMRRLSRVLPIYQNDSGVWCVCALQELECVEIT